MASTGHKGEVSFKLEGSTELRQTIQKYVKRVEDVSAAGNALVVWFHKEMEEQFASEGGLFSGGWAPWKPSTAARKKPGDKLLDETGRLKRSLTVTGARDAVVQVDEDSVTIGSTVPYLRFLDQGTSKMVARPVFGHAMLLKLERQWSKYAADRIMGRPLPHSGGHDDGGGGSGEKEGGHGHGAHEGHEGHAGSEAEGAESHLGEYFDKVVDTVKETLKEGRERGREWAEKSKTTEGRAPGGGWGPK